MKDKLCAKDIRKAAKKLEKPIKGDIVGERFFKNIKIYQNKGKDYWSFGWKFEYKGEKYGNYIDNTEERTKEKLDCENQIAMLKMMILAMEKISK